MDDELSTSEDQRVEELARWLFINDSTGKQWEQLAIDTQKWYRNSAAEALSIIDVVPPAQYRDRPSHLQDSRDGKIIIEDSSLWEEISTAKQNLEQSFSSKTFKDEVTLTHDSLNVVEQIKSRYNMGTSEAVNHLINLCDVLMTINDKGLYLKTDKEVLVKIDIFPQH